MKLALIVSIAFGLYASFTVYTGLKVLDSAVKVQMLNAMRVDGIK